MAHSSKRDASDGAKTLCSNRKARYDYHIEETYEAGIALLGSEVKSIRQGRANLRDSYAAFQEGELFLYNCHISPYESASRFNADPLRPRKLLMRREEIRKLIGKITQKGYALIPLKIYFLRGKAKVLIGLAKGKKAFDKRDTIKEKESKREVERAVKERNR